MARDAALVVRLEMGLDHREFFRLLPVAAEGRPFRIEGHTVRIEDGARAVTISLGTERTRALGPSLRMPATIVEFAFEGFGPDEAKAFVERFRLHYQRGGG